MDQGWSKKNGISRDGVNRSSSSGRPPSPTVKGRTLSSSSVERGDGQTPRALSSSPNSSPSREANSRSNNATSKKARSLFDNPNPVAQSPNPVSEKCQTSQGIPQVAIAVVGTPGSGKSTFIQHALDLKKSPTATVSSKKVSLEGVVSLLRVHEFNLHAVDIAHEGTIQWPCPDSEETVGQINGIVVIYSISDASSTKMIPSFLRACATSAFPAVLVCSKCDVPPKLRQVDGQTTERLRNGVVGNIQVYQSSIKAPDSHKRCLSFILRNIALRKNETPVVVVTGRPNRPRASTGANFESAATRGAPASRSKHQRVQSDYSNKLSNVDLAASSDGDLHDRREPNSASKSQKNHRPSSPIHVHGVAARPGSLERAVCDLSPHGVALARGERHSMTAIDECGPDLEHEQQKQASIPLTNSATKSGDVEPSDDTFRNSGVGFEELVDRLLSNTVTKTDLKFTAIFLCLYRKISAPSNLLTAVTSRFKMIDADRTPQAVRNAAQLRYLGVLAQWVSEYPGDFAHPLTRLQLEEFISGLVGHRNFSMVTREIMSYLDVVSEDDDTAWACSDIIQSRTDAVVSPSSVDSSLSAPSISTAESLIGKMVSGESDSPTYAPESKSATSSIASSAEKSSTQSLGPTQGQSVVEKAQNQARRLVPCPRTILCKVHWHLFMRTSDEDIAQEMTRIDWIMFSSIRPRDLVRHVSLSEVDRERCKSLENVTRMIHHFNHTAFWIANIILLRNKPKHRAKALEKCMAVAWRLRQLNNYNSLGAVVAGINGTAVHRLYQTRELVPHHVQKQFMRLEILMGTQKSHFAYRLAWSNTSTERIPFLPLHSRDLASAEEGNQTYIDEGCTRINWKKFEVIGEVVVSIQRSQATSYTSILRNEEVQRLILDSKFTKDDDVSMIWKNLYPPITNSEAVVVVPFMKSVTI
ncbi:MAG: hypothetical protein Q9180_002809 [Flavoplaca navasiana]